MSIQLEEDVRIGLADDPLWWSESCPYNDVWEHVKVDNPGGVLMPGSPSTGPAASAIDSTDEAPYSAGTAVQSSPAQEQNRTH